MSRLLVTNEQIAHAMGIADSTFRCFRMASAPFDLPFERLYPPRGSEGPKFQRGYHMTPVIAWIKRAAPHRATPEFERKLHAAAAENLQMLESA